MFCVIVLLDNLVKSNAYRGFVGEKLPYLKDVSSIKARGLTYLYNNNKLRKIVKIDTKKEAMIQKIKLMKHQLRLWNKKQYLTTTDDTPRPMPQSISPGLQKREYQTSKFKDAPKMEEIKEEYSQSMLLDVNEKKHHKNLSEIGQSMGNSSFSDLSDIKVGPTDKYSIMQQEEVLLEELKKKNLNWFTRFCNWLKRFHSNQLLLMSSMDRLEAIESELRHGKHKINTTLENELLISHYLENEIQNKERIRTLNISMPEKCRIITKEISEDVKKSYNKFQVSTLAGLLISNSSILCYMCMIFAHIVNGSMISLVYPVSIFCYACFEEIRPTKMYWKFIIIYTMVILIIKTIVKFFFVSDHIPDSFNNFLRNYRVGIEKVNGDNLNASYYIFEVLILLFVVMHMISLMFQGLWDDREIDIESIDEAAQRITNYNKTVLRDEPNQRRQTEKYLFPRSKSQDFDFYFPYESHLEKQSSFGGRFLEEAKISDIHGANLSLRTNEEGDLFQGKFEQTLASRWKNVENLRGMPRNRVYFGVKNIARPELFDEGMNFFDEDMPDNDDKIFLVEPPRALTEYIYEDLDYDEAQRFINEEIRKAGFLRTYWSRTRQKLMKNKYFKRLFPTVSAQKPGRDFYVPMALVQFVILIYIIMFFSFMERDYTNASGQQLQIRQFSALLVLAAFMQIFLMLLDRYIYIAKTFTNKEMDREDSEDLLEGEANETNTTTIQNKARSLNMMQNEPNVDIRSRYASSVLKDLIARIRQSRESYVKPRHNDLFPNIHENQFGERYVSDLNESTNLSNLDTSIKLKYYLQWVLVMMVHFAVFWFLTSRSNEISQGHYYCDDKEEKSSKMKCNEVKHNAYLVIFYLLYCLYFYYSALQIRYGYPELKKGNFLMSNTTPLNKIAFQVFLAIPFLLELKVFTDWSFTRTGLDVFQWIKFENIYGDLFIAKCLNKGYIAHKLGDQIPKWMKFLIGICGTFGLVIIISGPLLLFSSLNPIAEDNFVVGTTLDLSIEVNVTTDADIINKYVLFH